MNLEARANRRGQIAKIANDETLAFQASQIYLMSFKEKLEHLRAGDIIEPQIPVGKNKFTEWIKSTINGFFPELRGILEDKDLVSVWASKVADIIKGSSTEVLDPMKNYVRNPTDTFVKKESSSANSSTYIKSAQATTDDNTSSSFYTAPVQHSRYDPENPGVQLMRVKDKEYKSPVPAGHNPYEPWSKSWDYAGAKDVNFETGVQNQTSAGGNTLPPIVPFLSNMSNEMKVENKPYGYDREDLYGVKSPEFPYTQSEAQASNLKSFVKSAEFDYFDQIKNIEEIDREEAPNIASEVEEIIKRVEEEGSCKGSFVRAIENSLEEKGYKIYRSDYDEEVMVTKASLSKSAGYEEKFFGSTTMMSRQCPDHPGQQMVRLEDNVRQCPLDGKVYDFVRGFQTEDGQVHNGGTVGNQHAIPPGSVIIKREAMKKQAQVSTTVHGFIFEHIFPYLTDQAEYARRVLNYKFSKPAMSLEQAILDIQQADELAAAQKENENQEAAPTQASLRGFVRS